MFQFFCCCYFWNRGPWIRKATITKSAEYITNKTNKFNLVLPEWEPISCSHFQSEGTGIVLIVKQSLVNSLNSLVNYADINLN